MSWRVKAALVAATAILAGPAALAIAATSSVPITVSPKTGERHTKFVISFTAPASTNGSFTTRAYTVSVSTHPRSGCVSEVSRQPGSASAGERVHVSLRPPAAKAWCIGTYKGVVEETITPDCKPPELCPMYMGLAHVGRFSFRVK